MFTNPPATGYGVIIRNNNGEVKAASSTRGASAFGSEEVEVLACHHAVEYAFGLGIRDLGSVWIEFIFTEIESTVAK